MQAPTSLEARHALGSFLERNGGLISGRIRALEASVAAVTVVPYYSRVLNADQFPALMIEQSSEIHEWKSLDTGYGPQCEACFRNVLWGMVHGYGEEMLDDLLSVLAAGARDALNSNHKPFTFEGAEWYFQDEMPASGVNYGTAPFGANNQMARAFTMDLRIYTLYSVPQQL